MRKAAKCALMAVLTAALVCLAQGVGQAQGGLKVWPTEVQLIVDAGDQVEETVNVENQGGERMRVRAYVLDFSVDRFNSFTFSEPGHESYSASRWLGFNEGDFELESGERKEVKVRVMVPTEAEPGGHYAALFFESVPSASREGVGISTRIPCLFYVSTSAADGAGVNADCDIVSCLVPGIVEGGPVETGAVVHNSGNVHLTVAGKAYFRDSWGKESELDLGQVIILPGGERTMQGVWRDAPFLGRVNTVIVVGYFDEEGELVNKSCTAAFLVVPLKLLAGVVVGTPVLVVVLWRLARRYRLRLERR